MFYVTICHICMRNIYRLRLSPKSVSEMRKYTFNKELVSSLNAWLQLSV